MSQTNQHLTHDRRMYILRRCSRVRKVEDSLSGEVSDPGHRQQD